MGKVSNQEGKIKLFFSYIRCMKNWIIYSVASVILLSIVAYYFVNGTCNSVFCGLFC